MCHHAPAYFYSKTEKQNPDFRDNLTSLPRLPLVVPTSGLVNVLLRLFHHFLYQVLTADP